MIRAKVTSELDDACMPLRKWKSNNQELMFNETSNPSLDLNMGHSEPSKTLGLGWLTHSDDLCFPANSPLSPKHTKREMLSIISQVFDPMGLLAPSIIQMKMLLQRLWLKGISWDERLPNDIQIIWIEFVKSLSYLNDLRIPRRVVCNDHQTVEFHVFTDASERAYGACLYVRSVSNSGQVLVRLLMAKSRVAPLKPTTIPRLELCAALVGARLYNSDHTPLTPGHFIIGRPLTCLPQPDYQNHSTHSLTRFQRIEQLRQHFWSRWSKEYISELQHRVKWRLCQDNLKPNELVVIKDDHLPPLKWKLGRVMAVHAGSDGVVRVADIRTSSGVIRRALNRICPLFQNIYNKNPSHTYCTVDMLWSLRARPISHQVALRHQAPGERGLSSLLLQKNDLSNIVFM
ncbi:uncharacterized protein LOC126381435 [Pectinophora gossypiella]|uniref:uncharacterized protein LOC126381435 n=1 Tax=Pectinophora gossypiella TaxID=13191 RepID=UPI00214EAB75|nr:uncharacterized protein LOC126381435 [Pectinophora gossypiella]